jgi:hypothetical protein
MVAVPALLLIIAVLVTAVMAAGVLVVDLRAQLLATSDEQLRAEIAAGQAQMRLALELQSARDGLSRAAVANRILASLVAHLCDDTARDWADMARAEAARGPLPMPADLDQAERAAFAEIVTNFEETGEH